MTDLAFFTADELKVTAQMSAVNVSVVRLSAMITSANQSITFGKININRYSFIENITFAFEH